MFVHIYKSKLIIYWSWFPFQHEIRTKGWLAIYHASLFERKISFTFLHVSKCEDSRLQSRKCTCLSKCLWLDTCKWLCLLGRCWHLSLWSWRLAYLLSLVYYIIHISNISGLFRKRTLSAHSTQSYLIMYNC